MTLGERAKQAWDIVKVDQKPFVLPVVSEQRLLDDAQKSESNCFKRLLKLSVEKHSIRVDTSQDYFKTGYYGLSQNLTAYRILLVDNLQFRCVGFNGDLLEVYHNEVWTSFHTLEQLGKIISWDLPKWDF